MFFVLFFSVNVSSTRNWGASTNIIKRYRQWWNFIWKRAFSISAWVKFPRFCFIPLGIAATNTSSHYVLPVITASSINSNPGHDFMS